MPEPGGVAVNASDTMVSLKARNWALVILCCHLAGCAKEPEPAPVAPVKIQVTASDFCALVKRAYGPKGPTYHHLDTPETITGIRRLAASFRAKRCNPTHSTS